MNERIEELAEQCYEDNSTQIDVYKFAELIIKECVDQCEQVATNADTMTKSKFITDAGHAVAMGTWGGAKNCVVWIKNHFGVKE